MPGDLTIDLHPAYGLKIDKDNNVLTWDNRGGVEDHMPNGEGYCLVPDSTGTFKAAGSPKLETVQGASAVIFGGSDALVWDRSFNNGSRKEPRLVRGILDISERGKQRRRVAAGLGSSG